MINRLTVPLAAVLALGSAQANAHEQLPRSLAKLSPAHFADAIRIHEQPSGAMVLSTYDGYTRSRGLDGARGDDIHLRAIIDRSGRISWEVSHRIVHRSRHLDMRHVEYDFAGTALQISPGTIVHGAVDCPPTDALGSCNFATDVTFLLPDAVMRDLAGRYLSGSRQGPVLRFVSSNGPTILSGLAPAEAAGLVHAVDIWQRPRD